MEKYMLIAAAWFVLISAGATLTGFVKYNSLKSEWDRVFIAVYQVGTVVALLFTYLRYS